MKLLRNFNNASCYFDFDSKVILESKFVAKIDGWYIFSNDVLSALLVADYKLYFIWKNEQYEIKDEFFAKIENDYLPDQGIFKLYQGEKFLLRFNYINPKIEPNVSPFEYLDKDDLDWGLFVAEIINNKNRKNNFISNLMGST